MTERMIRVLVIASIAAVFLGGLVTGYVLGLRRAAEPAHLHPGAAPPPRGALLERFDAVLELSATQRDAIAKLLAEGERTMHETFARLRPELETHRQRIEKAIVDLLSEPQRARYREMMPDGLPRPRHAPPGPPRPPGPPP